MADIYLHRKILIDITCVGSLQLNPTTEYPSISHASDIR